MTTVHPGRTGSLAVLLSLLTMLAAVNPALGAPTQAVRGGGVVSGDLGVTSQLAFTASTSGGSFLCVMAGRSGGFPFGTWNEVLQMQVQGRVTPGSLQIDGSWSRFEGVARIHVVGKANGEVLTTTIYDVRFASTQQAGGAGEAWHLLQVPDLGLAFGPAPMLTGRITVHDWGATQLEST
jgi:hypothetical protein